MPSPLALLLPRALLQPFFLPKSLLLHVSTVLHLALKTSASCYLITQIHLALWTKVSSPGCSQSWVRGAKEMAGYRAAQLLVSAAKVYWSVLLNKWATEMRWPEMASEMTPAPLRVKKYGSPIFAYFFSSCYTCGHIAGRGTPSRTWEWASNIQRQTVQDICWQSKRLYWEGEPGWRVWEVREPRRTAPPRGSQSWVLWLWG